MNKVDFSKTEKEELEFFDPYELVNTNTFFCTRTPKCPEFAVMVVRYHHHDVTRELEFYCQKHADQWYDGLLKAWWNGPLGVSA